VVLRGEVEGWASDEEKADEVKERKSVVVLLLWR